MKKLIAFSLIGSSFLLIPNTTFADTFSHWGIKHNDTTSGVITDDAGYRFFQINSSTGVGTYTTKFCDKYWNSGSYNPSKWECLEDYNDISLNEDGNLQVSDNENKLWTYNNETKTWESSSSWQTEYSKDLALPSITTDSEGNRKIEIKGKKLLERKANGELHVGENSWITKEENGRQKVWAKDAAGNSIPIDYTNGTKLLINGRDVEQSINNVGALSAALTGLPTVPKDTTLACGLGTGTHGGDFAFSGGCASKVNEKLSFNYAASMTMPGQDYAGKFEDKFSARAGFVWQLGKTKKEKLISKQQEQFDQKVTHLKEENKELKSLIAQQNTRLEKLEKLTLALKLNPDTEVISLAK